MTANNKNQKKNTNSLVKKLVSHYSPTTLGTSLAHLLETNDHTLLKKQFAKRKLTDTHILSFSRHLIHHKSTRKMTSEILDIMIKNKCFYFYPVPVYNIKAVTPKVSNRMPLPVATLLSDTNYTNDFISKLLPYKNKISFTNIHNKTLSRGTLITLQRMCIRKSEETSLSLLNSFINKPEECYAKLVFLGAEYHDDLASAKLTREQIKQAIKILNPNQRLELAEQFALFNTKIQIPIEYVDVFLKEVFGKQNFYKNMTKTEKEHGWGGNDFIDPQKLQVAIETMALQLHTQQTTKKATIKIL